MKLFSALDICVLDLKNGIADFVKLGASNGYIKHINGITKLKCESLPVGIVRQIKPISEKNCFVCRRYYIYVY